MTKLTWETATDWDSAQSESGVVHEATTNTDHDDATIVKKGYPAATPLFSTDIVYYYPMMEDSGSTLYDFGGNNEDGSISGATLDVSGLLGTSAISFDGTDDYVQITDSATFDLTMNFSVAFWIKTTTDNNNTVVWDDDMFGSGWGVRKTNDGSNIMQFRVDDGSTANEWNMNVNYSDGNWHMIGFATQDGDGQNVQGYFDGSPATMTHNFNGGATDGGIGNSVDQYIGARGGSQSFIDADLCQLAVWNRELTDSEFQQYYDVVATSGSLTTAAKTS